MSSPRWQEVPVISVSGFDELKRKLKKGDKIKIVSSRARKEVFEVVRRGCKGKDTAFKQKVHELQGETLSLDPIDNLPCKLKLKRMLRWKDLGLEKIFPNDSSIGYTVSEVVKDISTKAAF